METRSASSPPPTRNNSKSRRKWDAEDRRMDEVEERTSAQTSGMAGFYSNLLTRNIAAGADVEKAAVSSYTHGSRRNAFVDEGPSSVVPQQEEDAAASALARFEDAVPPSAEDERKARAAFAASRGYDAVAEGLAKVEEEEVKPPPPSRGGAAGRAAGRGRGGARAVFGQEARAGRAR